MVKPVIDLTGNVFGGIEVLKRDYEKPKTLKYKVTHWFCKCHCGNVFSTSGKNLKSGNTKSCGCNTGGKGRSKNGKVNKWNLYDSYAEGITADGRLFYVDREDYDLVKIYRWRIDAQGYASANSKDCKNKIIKLHRVVMKAREGQIIDHINWDKTDNKKGNLRFATKSENNVNIKRRRDNTSGYTGVKKSTSGKWVAQISFNNKRCSLGTFSDIEDAVLCRSRAENYLHGRFSGEINREDLQRFINR